MAKQAIFRILTAMQVCSVDRSILETATSSQKIPDFEDAIQLACATSENLDVIITRDT
ncbi:PIN domain-containing protein [Gloeocapsopsis sp. IPPAS B-1203]|uniref:PIN domain-containing protein n=1 Tax=Gloeocapsopsis sp. IPPAS B-1203 TaxID=2049454 RepID=UPI00338D37CD